MTNYTVANFARLTIKLTLAQKFQLAIKTFSVTELKALVLKSERKTFRIIERKSSMITQDKPFHNLHLEYKPKQGPVIRSLPLAVVTRKTVVSSSYMDGYSIELAPDFHINYDKWLDNWGDTRFRRLYKNAENDSFNGGVEIDFPTAKKRMIEWGNKYPNQRNNVNEMDLFWQLFRSEMTDRYGKLVTIEALTKDGMKWK